MANRSYVYTVDTVPTKKKPAKPIRALSEYNWDIPLAHKILASENPQICQSSIWDQEIGVLADFATGKKRLLDFLDVLAKAKVKNKIDFAEAVAETKKVLADMKRGKFVLIEGGEIFDMTDGGLEKAVKRLVDKEIPAARKKVEAAIAGKEKKWLAGVAKTWEKDLGLYWADVLYFDFG